MRNLIIGIIIIVLILVGAVWFMGQGAIEEQVDEVVEEENMEQEENVEETATSTDSTQAEEDEDVKEFVVEGTEFAFSVKEMNVNQGDTVRIVFKNTGRMTHDWVLDEFDVRTDIINSGQEDVVEFVASETGTFEYYCSVGSHREQGMVGTINIE